MQTTPKPRIFIQIRSLLQFEQHIMTKEKTAVKKILLLLAVSLGILGTPAKTLAHAMQTNYMFSEELKF